MKSESVTQGLILEYLRQCSYVKKIILSNETGTLDIIGCYKGYFYSIEVKQKGKKPSALQQYNAKKIRENGGFAMKTDDFEEFKNEFEHNFMEHIKLLQSLNKTY